MNKVPVDCRISDCLNWSGTDFAYMNQQMKSGQRIADELNIRLDNLKTLADVCDSHNIPFWLQGKTLLGVFRERKLPVPDHDDDIAMFERFYGKFCREVYPSLKKLGFQAIRQDAEMVSIIRDNRYIDICFFSSQENMVGYGRKWFPKEHFRTFDRISFSGMTFNVPNNTAKLLDFMYPTVEKKCPERFWGKIYTSFKKKRRKLKKTRKRLVNLLINKRVVRPIPYEEFLSFSIESDNAINWTLRKPHLDIFTDGGRVRTIADIVMFLKENNRINSIKNEITDTPMSELFDEPINLNEKFWKSGNNFFFYCIYYEFRKGVLPYTQANHYIATVPDGPTLYSDAYFNCLKKMNDSEIGKFLKTHPIECIKGSVIHGKHRVCAMIGRILKGKEYIPFYVEEEVRRF